MVKAYVGIGSNLGDRLRTCADALAALGRLPGTHVLAASPFYETEPEDGAGPQWFVNAVAVLGTALAPGPLLAALQELRAWPGGPRNERGGRTARSTWISSSTVIRCSRSGTSPCPTRGCTSGASSWCRSVLWPRT